MYLPLEHYFQSLKMINLNDKERLYIDSFSDHVNISLYKKFNHAQDLKDGAFYNEKILGIPNDKLAELIKELIRIYNDKKK